jgi:hypothetical protein
MDDSDDCEDDSSRPLKTEEDESFTKLKRSVTSLNLDSSADGRNKCMTPVGGKTRALKNKKSSFMVTRSKAEPTSNSKYDKNGRRID